MKIALTNDHAAVEMRENLMAYLKEKGVEVLDCGVSTPDSVHYPNLAQKATEAVLKGEADRAVLICGTGIGMSIAANKTPGIRCALCTDVYAAQMSRAHNNANALALRGRQMDPEVNRRILDAFIEGEFEGNRHQIRLDLITDIEKKYGK